MDEASKIVLGLSSKLAELDRAVWRYRRDMTSEFDKYAEGLLRDVPKDVSETVSQSIVASMKNYPSLYSNAEASIESCATGTHTIPNGDKPSQPPNSSLPIAFMRPEQSEDDTPRSSHEREKEFRGVFTPSYLPLLDDTNKNERRSSSDSLKSPPPGKISPQPRSMDPLHVDASTSTSRSLVSSPEVSRPTTPRRRNTDEASVYSDGSESGHRRSALRRSSSTSRHSPRRVRFEVAGEEVLPTASPRATKSVLTEEPAIPVYSDEMDEGPGLEQIEDVEDSPPPKRISSSQALRALSRSPLVDDGTTWTTVTAPLDGSASVATANGLSSNDNGSSLALSNGSSQVGSGSSLNLPSEDNKQGANGMVEEEDTPSDDDLLDMPPLRRQARSPSSMRSPVGNLALSPADPALMTTNLSQTTSTRHSRSWEALENLGHKGSGGDDIGDLDFDAGDDDEMFHFDENDKRQPSPPNQEDEEYDDFDAEAPVSPSAASAPISRFSTSPARDIIRDTPAGISTKKGIIGSYKGHPFSMPIVSPDVHAQAASLGDVNTFVGSVDGRSGVDESDVRSFTMSGGIGNFSGTPRSMSERMMMDDLRQAEETKRRR